jgi:hypothetical protein
MKPEIVLRSIIIVFIMSFILISNPAYSVEGIFGNEEVDISEKPQYEYLADIGGNHDGFSEEKEESHLDVIIARLINRLDRFKRLPRDVIFKMNLPKRIKKYGIYIFTDKKYQCTGSQDKIYISMDEIIKEKGSEVFNGAILKYDKKLNLQNIWFLNDIRIDEEEKWQKIDIDGIDINYFALMWDRRKSRNSAKK